MLVRYTKKNTGGYLSKKGKMIRKPDKIKKGIMVAVPMDKNIVRIGWALCNFSIGDKFSDLGIKIAVERAETASTVPAAQSMIDELNKFIDRSKLYYKDKRVEVTFPLAKEESTVDSLVKLAFEDRMALE